MLLVGDLGQLSPVVSQDLAEYYATFDSPYFFSSFSYMEGNFEKVQLKKVFRQSDKDFLNILNNIREGKLPPDEAALLNSRIQVAPPDAMSLRSTNKVVDAINATKLEKINNPYHTFRASILGNFNPTLYPVRETLSIKEGARIAYCANCDGTVNGAMGTVVEIGPDESGIFKDDIIIRVQMDGKRYAQIVERYTWSIYKYKLVEGKVKSESLGKFKQYPIALGFARSIHKSQGATYNSPVSVSFGGWGLPGLVYVALSRVTSLENLFLGDVITERLIPVNPHVKRFLNDG